jgi:plastocyanin
MKPILRSLLYVGFFIILSPAFSSAAEHVVIQKDKKFLVDNIDIKLGDTIVFKNEETEVTHNVYSVTPKNEFEVKTQSPGSMTPVKIENKKHKKGKMLVECAIHPWMKLWVNIK